jgi:hypothetical protein
MAERVIMAQTAELAATYGELAAACNHAAVRFEFGDPRDVNVMSGHRTAAEGPGEADDAMPDKCHIPMPGLPTSLGLLPDLSDGDERALAVRYESGCCQGRVRRRRW